MNALVNYTNQKSVLVLLIWTFFFILDTAIAIVLMIILYWGVQWSKMHPTAWLSIHPWCSILLTVGSYISLLVAYLILSTLLLTNSPGLRGNVTTSSTITEEKTSKGSPNA